MFNTFSKKYDGFSLIEVLVTLVVLSVGLLSLGGLQITALKKTNDAHFRTEASLLLMDLSNKMRSNPLGIQGVIDPQGTSKISINCQSGITSCTGSTICDQTQLASFDLNEVACRTNATLPEGKLAITKLVNPIISCDAMSADTRSYYSMELEWIEMGEKGINDSKSTKKNVFINCFIP